ncbi:four helix bundle protein [Patescibacteria group bacterium]|nr:four helix bundle protein [Patescibacteria group bacterium]MBU1895821.1 four helix bundle protein [Patescibacteria group bacterium]
MYNWVAKHSFDLEERTAKFAENIILFCKTIPENSITKPIITQLVKSGTSQAANYCEACEAESSRDFIHKIGIVLKETKETKFWLRAISISHEPCKEKSRNLWKEANELNLIFAKSRRTAQSRVSQIK